MARARGIMLEDGDTIRYANSSGSTIVAGTIIGLGAGGGAGGTIGVAVADIANGTTGILATKGVFPGKGISGALTQGHQVYWKGGSIWTTTATGVKGGKVWRTKAAAASSGTVWVNINFGG